MLKIYDEKEQLKEILGKLPKPRTDIRPSSHPTEQQINQHKLHQAQQAQQHQHQNTS
jgi:hypothetical protein